MTAQDRKAPSGALTTTPNQYDMFDSYVGLVSGS